MIPSKSVTSDGQYDMISVINVDLGNEMGDLNDNLEHRNGYRKSSLIKEELSVRLIDEEVADLMQFQRSFRIFKVLNTRQDARIGCNGTVK